MSQNFKKLVVYQQAFELSRDIFNVTKDLKHFRLKEQLFGSITSICANLAEMGAFDNTNQMTQKVKVCIGEANETEFWLDFAKETGIINEEKHKEFVDRIVNIRKALYNLLKSMK